MKRLATVMAAAAVMAVVTGAYGAQLALAGTCTGKVPTKLGWTRQAGHAAGVLHWTPPASHPEGVSYRAFRDGVVIGQTTSNKIAIKVTPRRTYVFAVRVVSHTGAVSPCRAAIRQTVRYFKPVAPAKLTLAKRSAVQITVKWPAGRGGDGGLAGYRVLRNGVVVGQTHGRVYTLRNLRASTSYTITVRAVDSAGILSRRAPMVKTATLAPIASTGTAHAFLLASTDRSFEDFRSHYRRIGVVYPTYYGCRADYTIAGTNDKLISDWAQARKVKLLPRINCQATAVLHAFLTDPTRRTNVLNQLMSIVTTNNYDGLNIDFESGSDKDRAALTTFIQMLGTRLHAAGKKLSVCVAPTTYNQTVGRAGFYDYTALAAASDYIFVMGWGLHWAASAPGSMDPIAWDRQIVTYVHSLPNASRFVLGLGMYGMDWPAGGGPSHIAKALEYSSIIALAHRMKVKPVWDATNGSPHFSYTAAGVHHDVWFATARSLNLRISFARSHGLSVGFWHLGEEDPALWKLNGIG